MSIKNKMARIFRSSLTIISPKLNTKVIYRAKFGRKLDLKHPVTLNEKNLWLKFHTYWNNDLVKKCADKYKVREYICDIGLGHILNRLICAYRRPEDIEWNNLPNQFAIKLNIGCGYNHIVSDMTNENADALASEINKWLKQAPKSWLGYSEMQYKNVEPIILIEEYLGGPNGELPEDYKFYCINGKCEMIMFCMGRDYSGHNAKYYFLDKDWNMVANSYNERSISVQKPVALDEAIKIAETLSKPFPFVRVDLYLIGQRTVFGELTFTPAAGMDIDHLARVIDSDEDIDHYYGRLLKLPIDRDA